MSVRVEADPGYPAGHALIRVEGAAGAVEAPGFRLQQVDVDDGKLGPGGWQSSDALLTPDRAEASGGDLVLHVGWGVCRHLEAGIYEFVLPGAGVGPVGVAWPDIMPMHAGAVDIVSPTVTPPVMAAPPVSKTMARAEAVVDLPAAPPPVMVEPAMPRPVLPEPGRVEPPFRPPPPLPGIPMFAYVLAGLVLLLIGGAWYYVRHHGAEPAIEAQAPAATPAPGPAATNPPPAAVEPAAPGAVELGGLSVPEVLTRAPNAAAITAEGTRRLQGNQRDDGLLLLEAAADRHDAAASAALARLYDPVLFQPGGVIPRADPRQAARHYRDAARGGADVTAPREALRQSLQGRAQHGDLGADLTLKDFWP